MAVALHIAWRYLRGKKSHNAIQVVSGVSAAAVAVVTAAMVCVLSVMNGFGSVIEQMFSRFDPDLRIEAAEGKYFDVSGDRFASLRALPCVETVAETIEETALAEFSGRQIPAVLKGVDDRWHDMTGIDSILVDGSYSLFDGAFERTVMGQGLAAQLGVGAHFVSGVHLYAPKRRQKVNMLRPDQSFEQAVCFMAGVFAVNQVRYDDRMMLVSLPLARQLFDYQPSEVTALEVDIAPGYSAKKAKKEIEKVLGKEYRVLDRYEQQQDFFRILRIEKLLTLLLLSFIMLIAAFNLVSSLTMLIMDKREDIVTLRNLGASDRLIRRIFLFEGWLIAAFGAMAGLITGVALCLVQEHFGVLKLGNGSDYVLNAYPVTVHWADLLLVAAIVLVTGLLAAMYPAYTMKTEKTDMT